MAVMRQTRSSGIPWKAWNILTDQREHCKESGGADRSGDEGSEKDQGKDQSASDVKGTAGNEIFHHSP